MCIIYVIGKCCNRSERPTRICLQILAGQAAGPDLFISIDKFQYDQVIANPNFLCYTKHAVSGKIDKYGSDIIVVIDIEKWRMIHVKR